MSFGKNEVTEESILRFFAIAQNDIIFCALFCKNFSMCGDTNCQIHDCGCGSHGNHKCHCHRHEEFDYNGYREGDIVGEADFQIVDKDELENMKSNGEIGGNLGDDLVNLGFIDKDSPLYSEMKNEGREGMFYEEENN